MRVVMMFGAAVAAVSLVTVTGAAAPARPGAATRPHRQLGHMPLPVDQTLTRENSPQDMLQVDVTHSQDQDGRHVAYARVVWGDLHNAIKKGGASYYSNWDGHLTVDVGTVSVVHKIAFDDGGRAATRPAAASAPKHPRTGNASGRDQLVTAQGKTIQWKAAVVGATDGLLIQITADTSEISATLQAGKFTVPIKITPAPAAPAKVGAQ